MRLAVPIALNCLLVFAVYMTDRYTVAKKLSYETKQFIIGVLFGIVSAFASSYGVEWLGAVVNVRDAAPLSAGLIFGAPAGIISGLIGGLYRWFSVAWGAGTYTRLACTVATILAGFMAAGLRRLMFDDKKPIWGYGICITVVCEVIHMMLIFLTNMDDSYYAFQFVKGASMPMIIGNSIAVGVSLIIVSLLSHEHIARKNGAEQIAQTFQRWLLACIVIAYLVTSTFAFVLQNGMAQIETRELFTTAISDVQKDVRGKSDDYMLGCLRKIAKAYEENRDITLTEIAKKYDVIEINLVAENGLIVDSTEPSLINRFNMKDTEQSAEFMVLTQGRNTYVQEYGPVGSDGVTMRKFAGLALEDGGFLQIGYSADQFHKILDEFVVDVTQNRHVGTKGFVAVCDENLNLVTKSEWDGKHVSEIGIIPDENMNNRKPSDSLCETVVVNKETGYEEDYIYVFTFVEGYGIIAAMPKEEAMFMRDASAYTNIFMQVLIFATLFVFIYVLIKRVIINNLQKITNSLGEITDGNLNVNVDVRSNAEFASLSDDINSTVATLKQYIEEAAARIDRELEYAKQIQLSVLPTNFLNNEECKVYARMIAAKEVGGDFYDFYNLNHELVAFLVADVSGKGIPAAMFMMTAKTIIKDLAERGMAVNDILTKANEKLCENNESGMFVTAWMGILNTANGKLHYANAGHNPPLLKRGDGRFEYLRSKPGFVLAGMEGVRYRVNELELLPGDRIFLYTDGVPEATNGESELYGEERLLAFMNNHIATEATALLTALKGNIDEFVGEAPQFDDITMLMFDYKPKEGNKSMIKKVFSAKTESLDEVLSFVEETMESYECPMKIMTAVSIAIEEVFVNVAHYAYGEVEGEVSLGIQFDEEKNSFIFELSDKGEAFNPLEKPDPDITLSADERQIGGLGIFITKKTMDSVSYAYENNENILTMIKSVACNR